MGPKI
jgi:hypothetical protein